MRVKMLAWMKDAQGDMSPEARENATEQCKRAAPVFTHLQGWIRQSGKDALDEDLIRQMARILYAWARGVCVFDRGWKSKILVLADVDIIKDTE